MHKGVLVGVMALCLGVLFFLRVDAFLRAERAEAIPPAMLGEELQIEGRVVADPEERETTLHAIIELPSGSKVLALLPRATEIFYNDRVVLKGKLSAPEEFVTDTGRIFDYPGYLRVRGVSALMRYAQIEEREEGGLSLYGTLYAVKHAFKQSLEQILPEPQAALFEGILLGERRGLPEALTTAFIVASLIHIVVLSGYNISIVGEAILRALSFLPRRSVIGVGILCMVLFVLMTGATSTSVRAGIMAVIALLARYFHRPTAALRALAVAALAMLFYNPLTALYDTGFILSVVATFGLITLGGAVESKLTKIPAWTYFNLRSIAASTIAVQIFILPALLYFSGVLSFVALPANILALPLIPLTMLVGFVAGLAGMVSSVLAFVPAFATDMLLRYLVAVAEISAALPFASATIPPFPAWVALAAYVPLGVIAFAVHRRSVSRLQTN